MDIDTFSSPIHEERIRFGAYPRTNSLIALIDAGFTAFVDLTDVRDIILLAERGVKAYRLPMDAYHYLRVPLSDHAPPSIPMAKLIIAWVRACLKENLKVYIHCRGGHGRCATIAALLLMELEECSSKEALVAVFHAHQHRLVMKDRWRKLGAPQTTRQKSFVREWVVSAAPS